MSLKLETITHSHTEDVEQLPDIKGVSVEEVHDFLEVEKSYTVWQAVKIHKRILGYCIIPFLCGMTYGYDSIANGASLALPSFLMYFGSVDAKGQLYAPSLWASLWTSMTNLGQAIGSGVAGPLGQRLGRRYAIMVFAIVTTAAIAVQYTATTRSVLLVGKLLNGFSVGGLLAVGTTYASDVSPTRLRGPVLQGLVFFAVLMLGISLGIVRSFVPSIDPQAFRTVFALQWLFGGLPLLAFFIPESPTWLLSRGRTEDARRSLGLLYGKDNNIDLRLSVLKHALETERSKGNQASFVECFRGLNLKRTATVSLLYIGFGLAGSALLAQNIYFLLTAGLAPIHSFDVGIGGFFLACLAIALGWVFTDKIGRRRLLLIGVAGNFIGMVIIGCLAYAKTQGGLWVIAVIMNLLISWQSYTVLGVTWTLAPELSSYDLRQYTQSIGYVVSAFGSWVFQFTVTYMYNVDTGNLGARTGFVFAGTSLIFFVLAWIYVPETVGLTVEEIDKAYLDRVPAREFYKRRTV